MVLNRPIGPRLESGLAIAGLLPKPQSGPSYQRQAIRGGLTALVQRDVAWPAATRAHVPTGHWHFPEPLGGLGLVTCGFALKKPEN